MSVTDTCHQADLIFENIGRQCTCNSLASMVYHGIKSVISWTSNAILKYGDSLYSIIFRNSSNESPLVTSFPQVCVICELRVQVLPGESYTGLFDSNANTPPYYNFETTISNIHQYGILTLGPGMPSFSISIIKHLDTYFVFDSHSRNSAGMFCADGQLCLRITHLYSLFSITHTVSVSLGLVSAQYEITHFELKKLILKMFILRGKSLIQMIVLSGQLKTLRAKKAK